MSGAGRVRFERMAVLGMGLLGGSVSLAARTRGTVAWVAAASRTRSRLERAKQRGIVDEVGSVAEAVRGADLVVLGSPVEAMPKLVQEAAPHLRPGALVTDVGSVKACLAEALPSLLPEGVIYIGSHPMAGSHHQGALHAREDLFAGAVCVVTPTPSAPHESLADLEGFWTDLGAVVMRRSPAVHDAEVAWISHVPHVLAFAFSEALGRAPDGAASVVGSGFRDFTRIASSDAALWSGILMANRKNLEAPLENFRAALDELAETIQSGDGKALQELIDRARKNLEAVVPAQGVTVERELQSASSGGENPDR